MDGLKNSPNEVKEVQGSIVQNIDGVKNLTVSENFNQTNQEKIEGKISLKY